MSSIQALVRLPLMQRQRDVAAGLNTAGFVTGYRGSPIGTYDFALWAARKHLEANQIQFLPAVNEELAAAAIKGTQWLDRYRKGTLRRRIRSLVRQAPRRGARLRGIEGRQLRRLEPARWRAGRGRRRHGWQVLDHGGGVRSRLHRRHAAGALAGGHAGVPRLRALRHGHCRASPASGSASRRSPTRSS